jgi:hypothetical protein
MQCYEDNRAKVCEGWMLNCIGEILLNANDRNTSEAKDWIKRAIEEHKKYGMRLSLAKDYALYSSFFKRTGDMSKARENLGKAIGIFKECGADGWVEKYKKELTAL